MILLIQQVAQWWIAVFAVGIIGLPIALFLFKSFLDRGYIFSKIIGIILITYIIYLLATIHLLPFTTTVLFTFLVIGIVLSFILVKKIGFNVIGNSWKIMIFEEILFFAGLFFWSYIKSFQPDIHGLEKFMDYGFINSILRTTYFPPKDMWMAPLSINYYYFGHLMTAVLTKISLLPSYITFDLMLATIFALTFTESFSIGANLIFLLRNHIKQRIKSSGIIAGGLITAVFLTLGGNLHAIYTFFTPYQNDNPVPPTLLKFSPQTFPNQYWYPNATRFIYHTIHEFPIYSFVVSDLHGHVLDIPAVLLTISILLIFLLEPFMKNRKLFLYSLLLGGLASILYMTNAWDGLIYMGVSACVIYVKSFAKKIGETFFSKRFLLSLFILLVSFVIFGLPFSFFFKPFASQIGINCAPQFLLNLKSIGPIIFEQGYCQLSPLWQLAILYGFFFFWFVSFLAFLYHSRQKKETLYQIDLFMLGMGILGFTLIIVPELVYLKDIYTTYFRANTMFKLVYQSFILLSLFDGYAMFRIITSLHLNRKMIFRKILAILYIVVALILCLLVLIYPYFAISSYFNNLKDFQGLNGITYLQSINRDDYAAVAWINKHIKGQPVMLEAQGDSYTDYERISANTGLPTVFGWMVHEWLWRGTYDIVPGRIADVQTLYTSDNLQLTKQLLEKYTVSYVYIGDMERVKYPGINESKYTKLGTVVYSHGSVKIYRIHD